MITAAKLQLLTQIPAAALKQCLGKEGKNYVLTSSKFLGITNAGQFCYHVDHEPLKNGVSSSKVFVTYNSAEDQMTADIN